MNLKQKTLSGLVWTFTQQFSGQFLNFFVSIILARLLSPAEFGLLGMMAIFISIGNSLLDSGLTSSIIRTPNADQKDYSTVFCLNMVGSVVIYGITFLAAPLIADFYKHEILTNLIRVYTLTFIITAFMQVQAGKLTKEMNFKTQLIIQLPSIVGGGSLGIILAYYGYGVWSLVWMGLFQTFLASIQHWLYSGWRPDLKLDWSRFKHHFNFGYKITLSGLLETFYQNLYYIIIGKYFSAAQLGYYTRALSMRQLPVSNITQALTKVTYPMFSEISEDDRKLKEVYKKVMQQVVFWVTPILVLLMVVAEPLFRFLLSEKWLPAVPYFQILCIAGMIYPLQTYNYNILKVKGRTDITLKVQTIKKVYCLIGILCAIPFGIYGLLCFQVLSAMIDYSLDCHYGGKMINYPVMQQLRDVLPSMCLAFLVGSVSWGFDSLLVEVFQINDWGRLFLCGLFYFSIYLGLSNTIRLAAVKDFRQLVLKR